MYFIRLSEAQRQQESISCIRFMVEERKCPTKVTIEDWSSQLMLSQGLNGHNSFTGALLMQSLSLVEQIVSSNLFLLALESLICSRCRSPVFSHPIIEATPKSLMRAMGVPGLTLYHLKSHLQKYRLAKNRNTNTPNDNKIEADCKAAGNMTIENEASHIDQEKTPAQFNEPMVQMQVEVQRKLQEQIEVQRHLQLRIEAQGKYLQSVLRKAQETLAGYSSNSLGVEAAKAELSELVSAVETECLSSSFSQGSLIPKGFEHTDCSTDSCLTSSLEGQEAKVRKQHKPEHSSSLENWSEGSDEINPNSMKAMETQVKDMPGKEKGSCSSIHGEANVEQPASGKQETNSFGVPGGLDLNR